LLSQAANTGNIEIYGGAPKYAKDSIFAGHPGFFQDAEKISSPKLGKFGT
jgi:hypothetical protein